MRTTAEELRQLEVALRALIGAQPTDEMRAHHRAQLVAETAAEEARTAEQLATGEPVEEARGAGQQAVREARTVPTDPAREARAAEQLAAKEARAAQKQAAKEARAAKKDAAREAREVAEAAVIGEAQIYGRVTQPMLRTISELNSEGERLWLILVSWGEGALLGCEDCVAERLPGASRRSDNA